MLRKLLKYDLRYLFKYWWILAVISLGFSVLGGLSMNVFYDPAESPDASLFILAILTFILSIFAICAFVIGTEIFIFTRFQRNFFTDEGYLTFTLPVTRYQLLNSKLISATILNSSTFALVIIELLILFGLSPAGGEIVDIFSFLMGFVSGDHLGEIIDYANNGAIVAGVVISFILHIISAFVFLIAATLLIYCCITVYSIISTKRKIIAVIAMYYGTSTITSIIIDCGSYYMNFGISGFIDEQNVILQTFAELLWLLIVLALTVGAAIGLYTFLLHMLHKKLNLS